jgi:glycosyltransferase involved in cell wall biosynthesis
MDSVSQRKIKILYAITKGNWGGAQKYVYNLATSLPKDQYETIVAMGEGTELAARLATQDIRAIRLARSGRDVKIVKDFFLLLDLIQLFREERPDIVHLNSSKMGALGAIAARLARIPRIIFTAHGWAFNEDRPRWQRGLIALTHWLTIILSHQTICLSEQEKSQVDNWPGVKNKLQIIRNGIEPINFLPQATARAELSPALEPDTFWLGTIAELHQNKGLDFLIEAISQLAPDHPELKVVIIGEGEEHAKLEKLIAAKNLVNRIFLIGQHREAGQYLLAFDLFVLPSRKEGLPFALLEAGQAGLPVIASRVGGIPEIITDNTGLLVEVGNIAELTDTIEKVISHPDLITHLGHNLQKKIAQEFSLGRMLTATLTLYCGPKNSL